MRSSILKIISLISIALFSVTALAQNVSIKRLNEINYIEIHYFKGNKVKVYKSNKGIDLMYLKGAIKKAHNEPNLQCDTTGEIVYFKNKTPLFKVYFCTKLSGSKYSHTAFVMFRLGTHNMKSKLNYGSGMLIDEEYYQLQKHN